MLLSAFLLGRCLVESLVDLEYMLPSVRSGGNIHLILAGPLTIVASSQASDRPTIFIFDQYHRRSTLICEPASSRPVQIAALALNQAPPVSGHQSVVCCLSTGELYTFSFSSTNPSSYSKSLVFQPSLRSPTISNIIRAAYYHPLLVILADSLSLFIYDLSSGHVQHTQTLTTFTCYPPTSLVLSSPSALLFKVVITYGSPVYPQHWSVGATEIMISKVADKPATISNGSGASLSPLFKEEFRSSVASAMIVMSTRSIRAFDVPKGWIDTNALLTMREQWGRKVFDIAAAQTDGKWVVLAPGSKPSSTFDHSSCPSSSVLTSPNLHSCMGLQLYRLILPAQSNPAVSTSPPKLNFVRMLHGHTSMVAALTVADGRCISLGKNGSIWVWDLEVGSGTEVAPSDENVDQRGFSSVTGMISFDERRIVTVLAGKVVVRRFDIWYWIFDMTSPSRYRFCHEAACSELEVRVPCYRSSAAERFYWSSSRILDVECLYALLDSHSGMSSW